MKLFFFFQNEQNFVYIQKMEKKFQKIASVFEMGVFEPVAVISSIYDENRCDLQWTGYQTVRRFRIWLREMFSNWLRPRLMKNWDKSIVVQVPAVFGTRENVYWQRVF